MIDFKNKKIYFSGCGEKIDKDELVKYFIQNEATMVESVDDADVIIQGYMTAVYLEDEFYTLSQNGIVVITIEEIEKYFSSNLDIDSILMAIKISKEKQRVINLLKNRYFNDEIFVKILKYYDWENVGIYDSDDNRDVATSITSRFCSLTELNHNIQHSPIGIYYTALETKDENLLEVIYNMPHYKISDKNAKQNQPLTLKEVVAINPNTKKSILMQILKENNLEELKFLALNESLNKMLKNKLLELDNDEVTKNLIHANNIESNSIDSILQNDVLKDEMIKSIKLNEEIFDKLLASNLTQTQYIYLSSNQTITTDQINTIFEQNIENANINLLKNENCSLEKIEEFLDKNDKIYNIAIAHNTSLNKDIFQRLLVLDDFDINLSLSYNQSTPQDIIKALYEKNIEQINEFLSSNENTPINILMQLQVDSKYTTLVSDNETYRAFSRRSLGIIQERY
jgi:hypothetical protein